MHSGIGYVNHSKPNTVSSRKDSTGYGSGFISDSFDDPDESTPILRTRTKSYSISDDGPTHWILGIFILINAIIGAGILTLPYGVLHSGGLAAGLACQIVVLIFSLGSALILGWLTSQRSMRSMQDICAFYLGRRGQTITSILLVIFYFLVCIAYITAIRDQLKSLLTANLSESRWNDWYLDSRFIVSLIVVFLVAPLCFLPEIDHLKHLCSVASLCVIYIAAMVVAGYYEPNLVITIDQEKKLIGPAELEKLKHPNYGPLGVQIWYGLPSFLAAYSFQPTAALVYDSLSPRTFKAYTKAIVIALLVSAIFYNVVVVFAIMTFGQNLQSHILLNYNGQNVIVIIGSTFYMVQLWLEYPLIHFTAREGILTLLKAHIYIPTGSRKELGVKVGLAIGFITATLAVALLVPQVMLIIQFAGIPNGVLVSIIPGMCLAKKLLEDSEKFSKRKLIFLWFLACFYIVAGAFFVGYVTVQSINAAISTSNQ